MAGTVKGITIEFNGNTTNLSKAISDVRKESSAFDKELGYINNSLKFNPGDVNLTAQKMEVLRQASQKSEERVKQLRKGLEEMKENGIDETSAEYRELEREIIRAESKQKEYNKQIRALDPSKLEKASAAMKGLGDKLTSAGQAFAPVSAAAGAVDVALAGMAYKAGAAADDLNTLSKQTGISTGDLQKYKAAADLVDVSVETMARSHTKLKKTMYQAQNGSKNATEAFDKLGISVTDSNGELRDADEVFDDAIKALGKMENPTERDAIAMQIFGKNATELNSLIADGGKTYEQVAKIYDETGLSIIDQESLDKANEFNDSIDSIKLIAGATLQQIGTKLAGYLAPALEKVVGWVEKIAGWLTKLDPEVLAIIGVIAGVVAGIAPLLIVLGKVATGISAIMSVGAKLGPLLAGLSGPVGIVIAILAALVAAGVLVYKNWDTIKAKAKEIKDWVVKKWTELKTSVSTLMTNIKTAVTTAWDTLKTSVSNTVTAIKTAVTTAWNNIKTSVSTTVENIKTAVSTKWEALKTAVSTKVETLKTYLATKWDDIKTKASNTIETAKESVKGKIEAMKESVKSKIDALKDSVKAKFDAIKDKITGPIETAKDKIKTIIDKIKTIFSGLKLELPHFKLPHFKVDGGKAPWGIGGAGKAPSFDIEWYKKGGIFDSPSLIGVGEAGPEAVLPIEKLKDWMQPNGIVINVYGSDGMDVNELASAVERKLVNSVLRKRNAWG